MRRPIKKSYRAADVSGASNAAPITPSACKETSALQADGGSILPLPDLSGTSSTGSADAATGADMEAGHTGALHSSALHAPHSPPGALYMVSVPIGNLADISLRALYTLRSVREIICENPATTRRMTEHYQIHARLIRYNLLDTYFSSAEWAQTLLAGNSVAFVCDAGTPGIADPGVGLAHAALRRQLPVIAVPGPAAVLTALIASGLPMGRFAFDGFPPRSIRERNLFFHSLKREERTMALYESAAYLRSTLKALQSVLGADRPAALACRLTQANETWARGTLAEIQIRLAGQRLRGEYTLVIQGNTAL